MLAKKGLMTAPAAVAQYVEDVFSTYLYSGTSATQTINNGVDLAGEGGMLWIQERDDSTNSYSYVTDSERGSTKYLITQVTNSEGTQSDAVTSFNSNGFTLGADSGNRVNTETGSPAVGKKYASWTFRKAEKFFDVVTYTGNGSARTISHNLGSTPGCIIVKRTDTTGDWYVYHRSNTAAPETDYLLLNSTAATADLDTVWNDTAPTSTVFSVGTNSGVNANSGTYVAYLFAHDAGGFGNDGDQSVIKCGSFTTDGSGNATIDLGWEPQWLLVKFTSSTSSWFITDNMRGLTVDGYQLLKADTSDAESSGTAWKINSTGFTYSNAAQTNKTLIYIAIRRGPMKVPTDATKVFGPAVWTGTGTNPRTFTDSSWGFVGDYLHNKYRSSASYYNIDSTRLTGSGTLSSNDAGAELNSSTSVAGYPSSWNQTGFTAAAGSGSNNNFNASGETYVGYMWGRAPGFFDVVCYTGTGVEHGETHNLGVAPEFFIVKNRTQGGWDWVCWYGIQKSIVLNVSDPYTTYGNWFGTNSPTATTFPVKTNVATNQSGDKYVAYLFASCPGVSKFGTYTGTGTTKQIDCGFTGGARFVLIKRTDSSGDWYYWDSARGIVAGNDPYLLLNSSAAEVTNTDYVDTYSAGFEISSTAPAAINANGGTFIFLAIA